MPHKINEGHKMGFAIQLPTKIESKVNKKTKSVDKEKNVRKHTGQRQNKQWQRASIETSLLPFKFFNVFVFSKQKKKKQT